MLKVTNPYTNEIVGSVKSCTVEDIDIAVNKLKSYKFDLGAFERSLILTKAVEIGIPLNEKLKSVNMYLKDEPIVAPKMSAK